MADSERIETWKARIVSLEAQIKIPLCLSQGACLHVQQHRGGERKSYWVSDQRPFDPGKEFWSFLHYADLEACYMELLNEILPLFCFFFIFRGPGMLSAYYSGSPKTV